MQFRSFGDSAWNMELRVWIGDPKRHKYIESAVNFAIVRKFREYGVEIPFPQRDLHLRSSIPVPVDSLGKTFPEPGVVKRSSENREKT